LFTCSTALFERPLYARIGATCLRQRLRQGRQDCTRRFAASPNKTGLTIGDIVNINKKGWAYRWVRDADAADAAAKAIVKKPIAVYVEKVYEEGDFSTLGIGT